MSHLVLADDETRADLHTYAARARHLDPEAALRLHGQGRVLAVYAGVLPGRGITGSGAVLGLRVLGLAEPADVDVAVPVAAILDRLARPVGADEPASLAIPPVSAFVPWAGISPPRGDWSHQSDVDGALVVAAATAGIAEVAAAGTGLAAQVEALRARVWSRPFLDGLDAPAGLAFAAYGLGFIAPDAEASVLRAGPWWRLTTRAGHCLART